ncbi:MAG: Protoheme farnesyltransferase [Planctomycetota bacterium]
MQTAPTTSAAAPTMTPAAHDAPPGAARVWAQLTKARLSALVLLTAAAGFVVAPVPFDAGRLAWACLGTAMAAMSAAMLNQLAEIRRDGQMRRTAGRPLPAGHARPRTVFVVGIVVGYAGCAMLAWGTTMLAAGLAATNILLYVLLYTPLKPRTTLNTLVGAVTGAIPPVIGWTAATGSTAPGAWALFGILFAWQLPHFLALAWLYRADYEAGGFAMLPSRDPSGLATAQACVLTSLTLVPVSLLATLTGVAGVTYAAVALVAGSWLAWLSMRFLQERSDPRARALFLGSLAYLPILLGAMVLDRGSVVTTGSRGGDVMILDVPASANEANEAP